MRSALCEVYTKALCATDMTLRRCTATVVAASVAAAAVLLRDEQLDYVASDKNYVNGAGY